MSDQSTFQLIFSDPVGRYVVLIGVIVAMAIAGTIFGRRVSAYAKEGLDRLRRVSGQLENDHVTDPKKTGNIREDMDEKFTAVHERMDLIGNAVNTQGRNIATILEELADMRGKDVFPEQTVNGSQILRIAKKGEHK